jgi:DNA polymerase III subunit alpha
VSLQAAPAKHTNRERLTWERELLGLYVSAHPLDSYDAYFQEQTVPISQLNPSIDNKKVTIGGLITSVRTIITKSGSKMAFVAIEDKTGESEIIVFPNLYSEIGAKLAQDAVIRAEGKVNARDREGNLIDDVKLIADEINFVSDRELSEYESTGRAMKSPKPRAGGPVKVTKKASVQKSAPAEASYTPHVPLLRKLFVHIKNPDDAESLVQLKDICSKFPGTSDIVLVLGTEKKSAIRLPFRVEDCDELVDRLVRQLGEDAVLIK